MACEKDNDDEDISRAEILSSTRWKTTVVKDSVGSDVTAANQGFVGLATYNKNGTYEFFNLDGTPRGDSNIENQYLMALSGKPLPYIVSEGMLYIGEGETILVFKKVD